MEREAKVLVDSYKCDYDVIIITKYQHKLH
jgi:hypothetical protein